MIHTCIRVTCRAAYEDEDIEPYYCPTCREHNKQVAAQIDAQIANRPRKQAPSMLEAYNAAPKINGFMHVKL